MTDPQRMMSVPTHLSTTNPSRPFLNVKSTVPTANRAATQPSSFRANPMERLEGGFAASGSAGPAQQQAPGARPGRPVNRRHVSDGQIAFRPPKVLAPLNVQTRQWRPPGRSAMERSTDARRGRPAAVGLRPGKNQSRTTSSEATMLATPTPPAVADRDSDSSSRGRRRSPDALIDSPRGRDRKIVPLSNTARNSSLSTPSQRILADLPKTTPEMQSSSLCNSSSSLSPSLTEDPCTPGPTQMVIGPPMLGMSLAYAHVGTPTGGRNHDAEISQMLALGIDLDEGGPRGIKVPSVPRHSSLGDGSLRIGLPRAEETTGRNERTPERGMPSSHQTSERTRAAFIRNGLGSRSARIASPRGSALDLTNIVRSNDSRASGVSTSTITHHADDRQPDVRNQLQVEAQPEPTLSASPAALRERLRNTLSPPIMPAIRPAIPHQSLSTAARALRATVAKQNVARLGPAQRGSIRFNSEQLAKTRPTVGIKGQAKAMSFSAGDSRIWQRKPMLSTFHVKTVPSLSRQTTSATVGGSHDPNGSGASAAGSSGISIASGNTRTGSATAFLRKVQDDDLSTLQSIWSAPLQQPGQSGSGFMSPRPAMARPATAASGSFRQNLLYDGLARLGLGWATGGVDVATDTPKSPSGTKGSHKLEAPGHSVASLEVNGAQSRTSSGQSTTVFTPAELLVAGGGEWLYTRWDGKRVPITPEHPIHWNILSRRKASQTGTSRSKAAAGSSTAPVSPGNRTTHFVDIGLDGSTRQVQMTDFDVHDGYFAIPVQRRVGHKRSHTHLGPMERTMSSPGFTTQSPRKVSSGTGLDQLTPAARRPSFKTAMTMPSGLPTRSPRDAQLPGSRGAPPPAMSSQMAIAISQGPLSGGSSRKTPRRIPSSSTTRGTSPAPSTAHSLSTSFDSRMAYEAVKGEQGYVSFDHVMGLGEGEGQSTGFA